MSSVAVPVSSLPRPSADELRRYGEAELADRIPGALSPRERALPEMASSGISALDELTGGWPRGTLSELFGPASSGRTSILYAALAAATARGELGALIDAGDAFDPESAATAGVDLKKLLWIRCGKNDLSPRRHEGTKQKRFETRHPERGRRGGRVEGSLPSLGSPCFSETHSNFVASCLRGESIPTPQPRDIGIWGYGDTETMERIAPHLAQKNPSPRSHEGTKQIKKLMAAQIPRLPDSPITRSDFVSSCLRGAKKYRTAYARIEQALKAADLLLGGGGFGVVAFDFAGLPPEAVCRVPLTTWFRFRRAVEATSTVLLVVSQQAITQSCAALSLRLQPTAISIQPSAKPFSDCHPEEVATATDEGSAFQFGSSAIRQFGNFSHAALLTGLRLRAEVIRSPRAGRKHAHGTHAEIETEARWA